VILVALLCPLSYILVLTAMVVHPRQLCRAGARDRILLPQEESTARRRSEVFLALRLTLLSVRAHTGSAAEGSREGTSPSPRPS